MMVVCVLRVRVWGRAARRACEDLGDRFCASDPGLIRFCSALTTVGGVLLTLLILGVAGTSVWGMVVGALIAMIAGYAVSDPRPRGQAVTLVLSPPVGVLALILGALLAPYRAATDIVLLLLIFTAVYVRRYGPRAKSLCDVAFQLLFVSQLAGVTFEQLPSLCLIVALATGCSGIVRLGLVRATPERTLRRLRHAFRARLGEVVDAMIDVARAESNADRATAALQRQIARLHQCALMIQSRLDTGIENQVTASLVQRRIAEAEIAAEHLGVLLLRALRPHSDNVTTLALHVPTVLRTAPVSDGDADPTSPIDPVMARLVRELNCLRLLVARPLSPGPVLARVRDRLLGYRNDRRCPAKATGAMREVYRAVGELTRASMGLRLALGAEPDEGQENPEAARSRRELQAENLSLQADEADAATETTGLRRPSTRAALQVTAGSAMAIVGGELLSTQRWYWAMITCWVVYINTASVGEILIKGYRRLAGTMAGALAGIGLAALVAGHVWTTFALVILGLFGAFYLAPVSYLLMSVLITAVLGLLYTLLGTYSDAVLVLRIEETALGAASGLIAALLILPVHTQRHTNEQLAQVLQRMRKVITQAVAQLTDEPHTNPLDAARELDAVLDAFRTAVQPVTHPASPLRTRRRRARYLLGMLETCAYHARSLAAIAELVPGNRHSLADPRLTEAGQRLADNLAMLAEFVHSDGGPLLSLESGPTLPTQDRPVPGRSDPGAALAERVLRHLQRLDESVLGLARLLGFSAPRNRPRNGPPADGGPRNTPAGCPRSGEMRYSPQFAALARQWA